MARRAGRVWRPFNPEGPFVAGKPITLDGIRIEAGQPVDVSGLHPLRVAQMFRWRQLDHPGAVEVVVDEAPAIEHDLQPVEDDTAAEDVAGEDGGDAEAVVEVAPAPKPKPKRKGSGR